MTKPVFRWWWELLPLTLLTVTWGYLVAVYPELPARVPSHFGSSGAPDAWGGKGSVLVLPLVQTAVYLVSAALYFWMARVPDPRRLISGSANWSAAQKASFTEEQLEEFRRLMVRSLWVLNALVMVMLTHLHVNALRTSLGQRAGLGVVIWVYLAAVMGVCFWMTVKTLTFSPRQKRQKENREKTAGR